MIIVPTEKRFDWQHTPLALFAVVLLNILVFFLYQSGDSVKFERAFAAYQQNQLFSLEWPIYRDYLALQEQEEMLEEYEALVEQGFAANVSSVLLADFDFARYLNKNAHKFITNLYYEDWRFARDQVNSHLWSVSFLSAGLIPNDFQPLSLLSYQFLHGDLMHLLGNMFFLVVCGFAVEAAIGHLRFLLFYLVTGAVGGLCHMALNMSSATALVGASGAVSGVMAMYLGVFRFRKIEFFYWFFIFVGYFRAPALLILPVYIGKEVFDYFSNPDSNVAFMAHAGGFVAGGVLMAGTLLIKPKLVNEEYLEQDQGRDPFQEQLAKVYSYMESFQFRPALKAVQTMLEEYGRRFELVWLRCNLLKATNSEGLDSAVLELLRIKDSSPRHIKQQATFWQENPKVRQNLDDDAIINLGLGFANAERFANAEEAMNLLQSRDSQHFQLAVLAHKLADLAERLKLGDPQKTYRQLAESLLAR